MSLRVRVRGRLKGGGCLVIKPGLSEVTSGIVLCEREGNKRGQVHEIN